MIFLCMVIVFDHCLQNLEKILEKYVQKNIVLNFQKDKVTILGNYYVGALSKQSVFSLNFEHEK